MGRLTACRVPICGGPPWTYTVAFEIKGGGGAPARTRPLHGYLQARGLSGGYMRIFAVAACAGAAAPLLRAACLTAVNFTSGSPAARACSAGMTS